jgi:dinuclear metal center YbgI/SA1388 family protein
MAVRLARLVEVLEAIAPTRLAEPWDNVGLLVGDPQQDVTRAMLTVDYTPEVAREAAGQGCDAVVAYHPPLFDAVKRVTATGGTALVFDAVRRGVALYSPHTALDVAEGGTNDVLADALDLRDRQPLRVAPPKATHYKLVTFVPAEHVDAVSRALFDAGAGRIGDYSSCSFRIAGTGTFFGEAGATPAVGAAGRLERVDEVRLETVLPIASLDAVVRALRRTHPYDEPAFDLNQLAAPPEAVGLGRIGSLATATPADALAARIKRALAIDHVLVAGDPDRPVRRAAVCAGAGGDLLDAAVAEGADLYLTGELRHHDALRAAAAGMTVVCTLHSNSERAALRRLAARLAGMLPELPVSVSTADRDPFAMR